MILLYLFFLSSILYTPKKAGNEKNLVFVAVVCPLLSLLGAEDPTQSLVLVRLPHLPFLRQSLM